MKKDDYLKIYYDEEGDYLELFTGKSRPDYGQDIGEGITIFRYG